jgi:carbohydrate-selective porin OprB
LISDVHIELVVRVGKSVPTYDFNNVSRPVRTRDESLMIPSVTGLIYTPAFKNTTLLGAMPGYYNSAYGITTTLAPNENLYLSYGAYDGNGVHQQTGLWQRRATHAPRARQQDCPRARPGRSASVEPRRVACG